jgi:hypothetical protein
MNGTVGPSWLVNEAERLNIETRLFALVPVGPYVAGSLPGRRTSHRFHGHSNRGVTFSLDVVCIEPRGCSLKKILVHSLKKIHKNPKKFEKIRKKSTKS